jgi:hypothetical protein
MNKEVWGALVLFASLTVLAYQGRMRSLKEEGAIASKKAAIQKADVGDLFGALRRWGNGQPIEAPKDVCRPGEPQSMCKKPTP